MRPGVLTGTVAEMVDRVGAYSDAGADWVILAMRAPFDRDGLERFAGEVLPQFLRSHPRSARHGAEPRLPG